MTAGHRWLLKTSRIVHLLISMAGMLALLFFSVTGLLLNHEADWFELDDSEDEISQTLPTPLLVQAQDAARKKAEEVRRSLESGSEENSNGDPGIELAELKVVEFFRTSYDVRGEARCDLNEDSIGVDFKAPGRSVVAVIQTQDGSFRLTSHTKGLMGKLLDLHRGKNKGSGWAWSLLLDVTCVLMVILALTGLIIWSSLKTRRVMGMVALFVGVTATLAVYVWWVP